MVIKLAVILLVSACCTIAIRGISQTSIPVADTIHIISYQKLFGKHSTGWSISYKALKDTPNVFTIPVTYSFGTKRFKKASLRDKGLLSLVNYAAGFGFDGYERIMKGLFIQLGIGGSIGAEFSETLTQARAHRFFISGNSRIGFLCVPFKELGITAGLLLSGSLSNSIFLRGDWGAAVELGINF